MLRDVGDMIQEMLFAADHGMELLLDTDARAETIGPVAAPGVAPLTLDDLEPLSPLSVMAAEPVILEPVAPQSATSAQFEEYEDVEEEAPLSSGVPETAMAPDGGIAGFCSDDSRCGEGLTCYDEVCVRVFKKGEVGDGCNTDDDCLSRNCQLSMSWQEPFQCAAKKERGAMCTTSEVCISGKCEWFECK